MLESCLAPVVAQSGKVRHRFKVLLPQSRNRKKYDFAHYWVSGRHCVFNNWLEKLIRSLRSITGIVTVARELWQKGQHKEALGLLYRGAISWVITEEVAEIEESDTELDCVRRVHGGKVPEINGYFERLTRTWMGAAYGGVFPKEEGMEAIWSDWPFGGRRRR